MYTILLAVLPLFLLISLGYYFNRIKFPNEDFWASADKFTYYVLFPSLLIYKLSSASLENIAGFEFVFSALATILLLSFVLFFVDKFLFFFDGASFTSIYQGSIRFNTYIFLALIDALYGDKGLVLAAFLITFMIPIINILCIAVFAIYTEESKLSLFSILKSIFTNPLIIACFIGGGLNYFQIELFEILEKGLVILANAALPLGLLSIGVGLQLSSLKNIKAQMFTAVFIKLALFPVMIFFMADSFALEGLALKVLILFAAMPTASSAYILARQLKGDVALMSAIITTETLLSIFTIFVFLNLIS